MDSLICGPLMITRGINFVGSMEQLLCAMAAGMLPELIKLILKHHLELGLQRSEVRMPIQLL